mgnify:FL=1
MAQSTLRINLRYFKKLYVAIGLILSVLIIGIVGFIIIQDYDFIDALFMTIITIGTVGYGEVKALDDAGKLFTSFLIIISITTFAYAISVITRYVIEGEFQTYFRHYKVNKEIQKLKDHVIVCGYGRNGKQACDQCRSEKV